MVLLWSIILLFIGLGLLGVSGEKSVKYAQRLSKLFGLNTLFIGFVLLAVSTGIPELAIVISSIWNGTPALSVGDLIGSNFADVSLVLGLVIVMGRGLPVAKSDYHSVVAIWLINCLLMGSVFWCGELTSWHGGVLVVTYFLSLAYLWRKRHGKAMTYGNTKVTRNAKWFTILKLVLSLIFVFVASQLCVFSAIQIVKATGFDYVVIGATIFALGTSLPEVILNVNAARQGDFGMAIGNSFGSVLEQGAFLLGLLALFSPTPLNINAVRGIAPFMFGTYALAGYGIIARRRIPLGAGWAMLLLYVIYLVWNYFLL